MTTAFEFAQQLGLSGTDSEIVAQLAALGVTERPISLAYLMEMLNLRGMLRKTDGSGGQERWVGTLQNLKAALVALNQTEAVTAYEAWFSHVTNPRQVSWDTTLPEYAAGFWSMRQNFAGVENMPSTADFAAIAALGGGWRFATLTAEEFASQRTQSVKSAALNVVTTTAAEAAREEYRKSDSTPESIVAAAVAVLEAF